MESPGTQRSESSASRPLVLFRTLRTYDGASPWPPDRCLSASADPGTYGGPRSRDEHRANDVSATRNSQVAADITDTYFGQLTAGGDFREGPRASGQTVAQREGDRLCARGDAELGVEVADMRAGRAWANKQFVRDIGVGAAGDDLLQNLDFAG